MELIFTIPTVIVYAGSHLIPTRPLPARWSTVPAQSIQSNARGRIDGNSTILLTSIISAVFDHLPYCSYLHRSIGMALSFKIRFQVVQTLELSSTNRRDWISLSLTHIYTQCRSMDQSCSSLVIDRYNFSLDAVA